MAGFFDGILSALLMDRENCDGLGAVAMVTQTSQPTVLVIDDENLFRDMLQTVLSDEYEVVSAESADTGLRLFKQKHPDAVLMDLVMPGRDGIEGLRAIRNEDPTVSVIIVTGFGGLESAKQAISLGASYYVEKPIDPEALRKTVQLCVERTRMQKRRNQEIEEMTGIIRDLTQQVADKDLLISRTQAAMELMYDMSAPMAGVLRHLHKLDDAIRGIGREDVPRYSEIVKALYMVERGMERCRDMTELSRAVSGETPYREEEVTPADLLKSMIEEIKPWARAVGVDLDVRILSNRWMLRTDVRLLKIAFRTLLSNALEASAEKGGTVRIAWVEDGGRAELRIEDHGPGVDMGRLEKELLPQFSPADVTRGAGMGLYLAGRVIEKAGGRLHVESAPGRGSVVFVEFRGIG